MWAGVTAFCIRVLKLPVQVGQGYAVLVLLSMVVLGYWILRPVDDAPRDWRVG
jgi:hypothetical protein